MKFKNRLKKTPSTIRNSFPFYILLLSVAVFMGYFHVTQYPFISFDDELNITGNSHVKTGLSLENIKWAFQFTRQGEKHYWHPLTSISHMVDCHFFGLNPFMHHMTNLLHHTLNVILIFLIFKKMTNERWKSFFIALLFAIHPINVESTAWVAERKNVLSSNFWLFSIIFYLAYIRKPTLFRFIPIIITMLLGLLSKPILVVLPFSLLLIDIWPLKRITWRGQSLLVLFQDFYKLFREKILLFVLSGCGVCLSSLSMQKLGVNITVESVPMSLRIANAIISYPKYLWKIFWPFDLAIFYPFPIDMPKIWNLIASLLTLIFISLYAITQVKQRPWFTVGWFWFLGILLPAIGLMQNGLWPAMADRWCYLPMIGISIIIAWGIPDLLQHYSYRKNILLISTTVYFSIIATILYLQTHYWKDNKTLFQHAVNVTRNNAVAHNNLANAFVKSGNPDKGIAQYRIALTLNPKFQQAIYNMGKVLAEQQKTEEAKIYFQKALKIDPMFAEAAHNLGSIFMMEKNYEQAEKYFYMAIHLNPNSESTYFNLGIIKANKGKLNDAIDFFQKAVSLKPDFQEAKNKQYIIQQFINNTKEEINRIKKSSIKSHLYYFQLGLLYMKIDNIDEAQRLFRQSLEIKPDFISGLNELVHIYTANKQYNMAIELLKNAIHRFNSPQNIYYNIACIYSMQDKVEDALIWLEEAIENGYDNWDLINSDKDLDKIRNTVPYEQFMQHYRQHNRHIPNSPPPDR